MKNSKQSHEPRTTDSELPKAEAPTYAGSYHSRGVPGEEGDVRNRMRVLKIGDRSQINKSQPLKGGMGAKRASAARLDLPPAPSADAGGAVVFVIAKKGMDFLDTPVFRAGESGEEETVALFTDRQRAQHYLDQAGWGQTDEIGELSASELLDWLVEANGGGICYVTVNPDRERHLAGDPQPVIALDALHDKSTDRLLQDVNDLARS